MRPGLARSIRYFSSFSPNRFSEGMPYIPRSLLSPLPLLFVGHTDFRDTEILKVETTATVIAALSGTAINCLETRMQSLGSRDSRTNDHLRVPWCVFMPMGHLSDSRRKMYFFHALPIHIEECHWHVVVVEPCFKFDPYLLNSGSDSSATTSPATAAPFNRDTTCTYNNDIGKAHSPQMAWNSTWTHFPLPHLHLSWLPTAGLRDDSTAVHRLLWIAIVPHILTYDDTRATRPRVSRSRAIIPGRCPEPEVS